jgi:hypothetical protein
MAIKKKTPSKKGKIRDLPNSRKKLTSDQAKAVKGGGVDTTKGGGIAARGATGTHIAKTILI